MGELVAGEEVGEEFHGVGAEDGDILIESKSWGRRRGRGRGRRWCGCGGGRWRGMLSA